MVKIRMPDRMRMMTLGSACALAVLALGTPTAFDAMAQQAAGMSGAPSRGTSSSSPGALLKAAPLPVSERDPAARFARSIECAQKADAQGLEGKIRKRFLHECKRGV